MKATVNEEALESCTKIGENWRDRCWAAEAERDRLREALEEVKVLVPVNWQNALRIINDALHQEGT